MWIEVPIGYRKDNGNGDNNIDYESIGIEPPEEELIWVDTLINVEFIISINSTSNPNRTTIRISDGTCQIADISYDELNDIIINTYNDKA